MWKQIKKKDGNLIRNLYSLQIAIVHRIGCALKIRMFSFQRIGCGLTLGPPDGRVGIDYSLLLLFINRDLADFI